MKKNLIAVTTIAAATVLSIQPVWANVFNENVFGFVVNSINGEAQGVRVGLLVDENGSVGLMTVDDGVSELSDQEYEFCWYDSGSLETYTVIPADSVCGFMEWEFVNPDTDHILGYIYEPEDIWGAKLSDDIHQGQELTAVIFDYIDDGTLHTVEKHVKVEDYYDDEGWDMLKISGMSLSSDDYYPIPFLNEQGDCVAIASDAQHILAFIDDETFYNSSNVSEQIMDHIDYSKIRSYSLGDDAAFYGYVEDGKMSGYGMLTLPDGDYYEGYFENSKENGLGVYTIPGEVVTIGQYVNNSKEGMYAQRYAGGIVGIHSYANDICSGKSIEIDIEKEMVAWGQFAEDTLIDSGMCESWEDSDGAVWYGKEKSSSLDGLGVYKKDGNIYIGEFSDGLFNGFGTVLFENGTWECGYYEDGQQKGMSVYINKKGTKQIGYWDGSEYIGNVAYYTEDGIMTVCDEDKNKLGEIQR